MRQKKKPLESSKEQDPKPSSTSKADESPAKKIVPKVAEDDDVERAIRTLAEAEEIKSDSELMEKIKPMLDKKVKSIDGLKKLYDSKYNKASHEEAEDARV